MTGRRVVAVLWDFDRLLRWHQLGFVALWPLLGLTSVNPWSPRPVVGLLAASILFNTFGTLHNDALHIALDKQDPLKALAWLVRGKITKRQALLLAGAQLPLAVVVHAAAGFRPHSVTWILGAFAGQALYNVYCKRCPVPPLPEAAEAGAAFMLVIYGATATVGSINAVVWLTAATGAAFIFLVNGFHSCLRDIEVELVCGQLTTPIWLGCTGVHAGKVHVSRAMSVYAGLWQGGVIALSLAVGARLGGMDGGRPELLIAVAAAGTFSAILLISLPHIRKPAWDTIMRLHLGSVPVPLMLAFFPRLGQGKSAALFLVYLCPNLVTPYRCLTHEQVELPVASIESRAAEAPIRT